MAGAPASRTGHATRTGLGARAVAPLARHGFAKRNFFLKATGGFFEGDFEIVAQIRAIAAAVAPATTAATTKHFFKNAAPAAPAAARVAAKDFVEDIAWVVKPATGPAGGAARAAIEGGGTIAVIRRALVGIAQDLVGVGNFLEHLLRLFVAGILVRVKLDGLLAIGLLHLFCGGTFLDAEECVVIFFRHDRSGSERT